MTALHTDQHHECGAVLVHAAFAFVALLAFTTFVVDQGVLFVARGQAQNAADAGALAGAIALTFDSVTQTQVKAHAIQTAQSNLVFGDQPSVLDTDVTFPPCPPDAPPNGTCIRVDVFRTPARGNALPTFFGSLIGRSEQGIQATAVAFAPLGSPPLALDEDAIDNGAPLGCDPWVFSDQDVNDDIADVGQRMELRYFAANPGTIVCLPSGQPGDEGWFAIEQIPQSWDDAGPTTDGAKNWYKAGPGLGTGPDPEKLLDKVEGVNPLDDTELSSLIGRTGCAVVPDSDVSMNYSPTTASLKGASLGVVGITILGTTPRGGGYYPWVTVRIESAAPCGDSITAGGRPMLIR